MSSNITLKVPRCIDIFGGSGGDDIRQDLESLQWERTGDPENLQAFASLALTSATGETVEIQKSHNIVRVLESDKVLDIRDPDSPLFQPRSVRLGSPVHDTAAYENKGAGAGAGLESRYGSALLRANAVQILSDFGSLYSRVTSLEAGCNTQQFLSSRLGCSVEITREVRIRICGSAAGGTFSGSVIPLGYLLKKRYPNCQIYVELSVVSHDGTLLPEKRQQANTIALLKTLQFLKTETGVFRAVYGSNEEEMFTIESKAFPFAGINLTSASNENETLLNENDSGESNIHRQIATNLYADRMYIDLPSRAVDNSGINDDIKHFPFSSFRVQNAEIPAYLTKLVTCRKVLEPPNEEQIKATARNIVDKAKDVFKEGTDSDGKTASERLTTYIVDMAKEKVEPIPFLTDVKAAVKAAVKDEVKDEGKDEVQQAPFLRKLLKDTGDFIFGKDEQEETPDQTDNDVRDEVCQILDKVIASKPWTSDEEDLNTAGFAAFLDLSLKKFDDAQKETVDDIADRMAEKPALRSKINTEISSNRSPEECLKRFLDSKELAEAFTEVCKACLPEFTRLDQRMRPLIRLKKGYQNRRGLDDQFFYVSNNVNFPSGDAERVDAPVNTAFIARGYCGLCPTELALSEPAEQELNRRLKKGELIYALPEFPHAFDPNWYQRWNSLQDRLNRIENEIQHPVEKRMKLASNDTAKLELVPRGTADSGETLFPMIAFTPNGRAKYDLSIPEDVHRLLASEAHSKLFFALFDPSMTEENNEDIQEDLKALLKNAFDPDSQTTDT